jgi:hypothetical protein
VRGCILQGLGVIESPTLRSSCLAFFFIEAALKLCAHGVHWKHAPLPIIDCALTVVSVVGQCVEPRLYVGFQAIVSETCFVSVGSVNVACRSPLMVLVLVLLFVACTHAFPSAIVSCRASILSDSQHHAVV